MIDHAHCGENEEIFYQEAKSIIDKILDGKANPSQKDELMKSCHYILTKYTGELVNFLQKRNQMNRNYQCCNIANIPNQRPCINLIYVNPPPNSQPPINYIPPSPYYYYPPNQMQMVQYPQYFQQPANFNPNYLTASTIIKPTKSNNKKKSKGKHHHHHEKSNKKKSSKHSKNTKTTSKGTRILFDGHNYFNGIIQYLRKKSNGNISSEVIVTASSSDFQYKPQNAINYDSDELFETTPSDKDPWLCIEFVNRKVTPKSYAMKSGWWEKNNWHPKSWEIDGLNDNSNWVTIDD